MNRCTLRCLVTGLLSALLVVSAGTAQAVSLTWDADGTLPVDGGTGTWDTSTSLWYNGSAYVAWVNVNNDTAVFGGTAGTVTLGAPITVGGLQFNTTAYALDASSNALTFGATNNSIVLNNIAAATITGAVGGSGNVALTAANPTTAGTLTLNGTSTGGWSGTTTINAGATMALAASNQALLNTTGITLNGGGLTLTNADSTEGALDRVNNSAGITSNGGTLTYTNTSGSGLTYAETVGAVALASGQLNATLSTNMAGGGGNVQTLTFGTGVPVGLTQAGTAAVAFSATGDLGTAASPSTTNIIKVNVGGTTTAGQIIGPWATVGTAANAQTDYAVYATDQVVGLGATATTDDSTWSTTYAATSNYNFANGTTGTTLTATRNINTLRHTGGAETLTVATGANLNTYGILNGVSGALTIAATGTGALSTPTGGGNLYVTAGSSAITISAPINNNGGAVTLVKSGSGTLTLSSTTSNYSGGTVVNAGALYVSATANLSSGGITFNGAATIQASNGGLSGAWPITLNNGAIATFTGQGGWDYQFYTTGAATGSGGVYSVSSGGEAGSPVVKLLSTANTFTGPIYLGNTTNRNGVVYVASLADSPSPIVFGYGTGGNGFRTGCHLVYDTGAIADLVLNQRYFVLAGAASPRNGILNDSSKALTVNTDLQVAGTGANNLSLGGTGAGLGTFAGKIADGPGAVVNLTKAESGTWVVSGANTYTGATAIQGGTLSINSIGNVGDVSSPLGAPTTVANGTIAIGSSGTGGTLRYTGSGSTTDRVINLAGTTGGATLNQSGTGLLKFTSDFTATGAGAKTLTLTGSTAGTGEIAGAIVNSSSATSLTKSGTGTWTLSGANTYTGTTSISNGTLSLTGSLTGSNVSTSGSGSINQGAASVIAGAAVTFAQGSGGTSILAGANSYGGATTVTAGRLLVNGSTAGGAVTVSGGALGGTGTVGGAVSLTTAGGIDLRDGAVGTLALGSNLSSTGAAGANNLRFDLASAGLTTDKITVGGNTSVTTAGAAVINLNQLGGVANRINAGTYDLIDTTGTMAAIGQFALATTKAFGQTFSLGLDGTSKKLQLTTAQVSAATSAAFWSGAGDANWSTPGNWNTDATSGTGTGAAPDYSTNVTFYTTNPGAANLTTNVLDVDFDINSLNFSAAATSPVTIGGTKTLTIEAAGGNGITLNNTSGTHTIKSKIFLAGPQTWTAASGGSLSTWGNIDNGGNLLTISGLGTITLSADQTANGILSGTGGLTVTGGATLISGISNWNPTYTYSGLVTVADGVLQTYNGAGVLESLGTGLSVILGSSGKTGTLKITRPNTSNTATKFFTLASGGTGEFMLTDSAYNLTISGVIDGSGNLLKTGPGNLILSGSNTYTGSTTVGAGTLSFASATPVALANPLGQSSASAANLLLANGTTLKYTGTTASVTDRNFTINGTAAGHSASLDASGTGTVNFASTASPAYGAIDQTRTLILTGTGTGNNILAASIADNGTGAVSVTKTGAGLWVLTGTSTYTGPTTLTAGTLSVNASVNLGAAASNLVFNGGTLQITGTGLTNFASLGRTVTATAGVAVGLDINNAANTFTVNQVLGTVSLLKSGAGTLVINQANAYTGQTTINAGTLQFNDGNVMTLTPLLDNATFVINRSGTVTQGTDIPAYISGSGAVNNIGSGTLVLGAPTYYTGTTKATAGTIQLSHNRAIQNSAIDTTGAGKVAFSGTTAFTIGGLSGASGDLASVFDATSYATVTGLTLNPAGTVTYGGVIANAAGMTLTMQGAGTQVLQGASTYSGATYLNAGTVELSGSGSILNSAITFGNGGLKLTNTAAETGSGRVSDTAAVTSNGGTLTYNNTSGASVYAETIGSVALTSGQLDIVEAVNQASTGSQTLTLAGLTQSGTSAVTFSAATTGPQASGNKNMIKVSGQSGAGAGQNLPGGVVIGPWATTGTTAALQTDYAVYDASGYVLPANITASAETTWSSSANAYTLTGPSKGATTLTASRTAAGLRNTTTATSVTVTANSATIPVASHTFNNGDPVILGAATAPTGFTAGNVYYVVNAVAGTSIQLSATPGGAAITPTSAGTTVNVTGGVRLDNNTLGTYGILNGSTAAMVISASGGSGVITLPTTTAGNLYVNTGSGAITITAPINDNTGALTLVKTGGGTLTLANANGYSGGTTLSAGTVAISNATSLGTGNVTVSGTSQITATGGVTYANAIAVNAGSSMKYVGANNGTATFSGVLSGSSAISVVNSALSSSNQATLAFTNTGNTFTGNVIMPSATGSSDYFSFASIGDGGNFTFARPSWREAIYYTGAANITFNARQIVLASTIGTASGLNGDGRPVNSFHNNGAGTVTFMTDMVMPASIATSTYFWFGGSNTGDNTFAGIIANPGGTNTLGIGKWDAGKWILSGANTYMGDTTINGGTLQVSSGSNLGVGTGVGVAGYPVILNGGILSLINSTGTNYGKGVRSSGTQTINFGGGGTNQTHAIAGVRLTGVNQGTTLKFTGTNGYNLNIEASTGEEQTYFANYSNGKVTMASLTRSGTGTSNARLSLNAVGDLEIGAITGRWYLEKNGNYGGDGTCTGTLILSGANNTYDGYTVVTIGSLRAAGTNSGTGTTEFQGPAVLQIANDNPLPSGALSFTWYTPQIEAYGAPHSINNAVTLASTLTAMTFGGSQNLSLTGTTTANGAVANITNTATTTLGAVLYNNDMTFNFANGSGNLVMSGDVTLNADRTFTVNPTGTAGWLAVTGVVKDDAATPRKLTKAGTGLMVLSGANTYSGATTVTAGTLQFANMVSLYNGATGSWTPANINVKSAATVALNVDSAGTAGFDSTNLNTLLGNISAANSATEGLQAGAKLGFDTSTATGGTFTQGNAIADSTGTNGGAIGVTKLGAGTLVFDKPNTYTGATNVSGGTLQVTGSIATTNANGGATVSATTATLELARSGGLSATPAGMNVSNVGKLLISTANQELGNITGTGTTEIKAGVSASLTANSIVQDTLTIGAGGSVTIRETTGGGANAVPEPGTWVLIGIGLLSLLAFRRRRAK